MISGYELVAFRIWSCLLPHNSTVGFFLSEPLTPTENNYVAQKVARDLNLGGGGLWMPRYDRVEIISGKVLKSKFDYIHLNPVKAGFVGEPSAWIWSSAQDYYLGKQSPIPVYKDWVI